MKREIEELNLRDAFRPMPEPCRSALMRAARSVEEEEMPVRKRIPLALALIIILGLCVIGTAYAVFSSQVAEFFAQHWSRELGDSLQEGKVAQVGDSVTIGDVVFTLDEIVYKDRALYGVGTVRAANKNDILIPNDLSNYPEWFAVSEEAQAFATKARASGGRMLTTTSMPRKIGVDEGTMLMPGCIGYYDIVNADGSLTFSFEASDGFAVNEGTSYQILMESWVNQINDNGENIEGTMQQAEWTVSCVPVVMAEPSKSPATTDTPVTIENMKEYKLITPAEYREKGTLPVWQAVETDLTKAADPDWFNTSGIKSGEGTNSITFNDNAVLAVTPDALDYTEFSDDKYGEAVSSVIAELKWMNEWTNHEGEFVLERTELSGITLAEAQAKAEVLMKELGIDCNQYVCIDALDMSLDRIRTMGALWEKAIADGELLVDDDHQPYDYGAIPASEEGYCLKYAPLGVETTLSGGHYGVFLYVNSRGIVKASIRNMFNRRETVCIPEKLISSDDAITVLASELSHSLSRFDKEIKSIQQVALTYEAVRAENKTDGMIFVPVWMILYQDEPADRTNGTCYAIINAVDGTLIDASFR